MNGGGIVVSSRTETLAQDGEGRMARQPRRARRVTGRMRLLLAIMAVSIVALGVTVWVTRSPDPYATRPCKQVVAAFIQRYPTIYEEAGSPPISCVVPHAPGLYAGFSDDTGIKINRGLSPQARAEGVADLVGYWRYLVAHEVGHQWGDHNGFEQRLDEYRAVRGFRRSDHPHDASWAEEDYAETFALWLGRTGFHTDAPYSFLTSAGKPNDREMRQLHAAGWLPDKG